MSILKKLGLDKMQKRKISRRRTFYKEKYKLKSRLVDRKNWCNSQEATIRVQLSLDV